MVGAGNMLLLRQLVDGKQVLTTQNNFAKSQQKSGSLNHRHLMEGDTASAT